MIIVGKRFFKRLTFINGQRPKFSLALLIVGFLMSAFGTALAFLAEKVAGYWLVYVSLSFLAIGIFLAVIGYIGVWLARFRKMAE